MLGISRCSVGALSFQQGFPNGQKNAILLRRQAQYLYFQAGYSKTRVATLLGVSKGFVVSWTQSRQQDPAQDARGWPKGQGRKWTATTRQRVCRLHAELERSPRAFYSGATAIQQRYRICYPDSELPPLRTIGRILTEEGLSRSPKRRVRGASRYLCYPEHTVYETLGARVLEADFIGQKYLAGRRAPLHFLGFSFKKAPKLRYFERVEAQTAEVLMAACERFFKTFEFPDVMKVDNGQASIGSGSAKRCLSRFMLFLLKRRILPVFAVPKKPFSQASIEGNNSVFARKFWNSQRFRSLRDVDIRLAWFNDASLAYTGYDPTTRKRRASKRDFVPRVYFIRQVHQDPDTGKGMIDVLNEPVPLGKTYINYFVLAEWNLLEQQLHVWFENDQQPMLIKSMSFKNNPNSKYRLN
ncbi:MAG: hypothetical protein R3348_09545 [Xanthomonadales bacterium]|nr:hypothetical protein [Xanthomonadales bacterium]